MKISAIGLLLLPALGFAFSQGFHHVATETRKSLNPLRAVKESAEKDIDTTEKKDGGMTEKPQDNSAKEHPGILSLRDAMSLSPFDAMERFFDDDFFKMPHMMDRMMPSVLSPMPLLRELQRDNSAILRRSSPAYEISEDEKQFMLSVDLPGVRPEDCKVELENEGRVLHLHGGRTIETEGGYTETRFDQRFTLGKNLDGQSISANLADGVMVVTAPKLALEEAPKTRPIGVTSNPHTIAAKENE
jgi:HSP20 family protein